MRGHFRVAYHLPQVTISNDDLADIFPEWNSARVFEQTGVRCRHYVAADETASDIAAAAIKKLIDKYLINIETIDFLIYVTQCPDYKLPSTSCILHERIGFQKKCAAIDLNLGCSGFAYALSVAKGLIASKSATNVLIVTSDNLSRYVNKEDRGLVTLIGDAATAFLYSDKFYGAVGDFVFGTDGSGYSDIIIEAGGEKMPVSEKSKQKSTEEATYENLIMNGMKVFTFAITQIPKVIDDILAKNVLDKNDIDLFIFHQANKTILEYLKKRINISENKFYINLQDVGNTSSSTIPLALAMAEEDGVLKTGMKVMILGFGVGLSWCGTIIDW